MAYGQYDPSDFRHLEGGTTEYYQPDSAQSLPSPSDATFMHVDDARRYIGEHVDVPARENIVRLTGGASLHAYAHHHSDGQFTNVYDMSVTESSTVANVAISANSMGLSNFLRNEPAGFAAASAGFLYLVDSASGAPRQQSLQLAIRAGSAVSLPVTDRDALVSRGGRLHTEFLRAFGEISIDNQHLVWAGSRTDYAADCVIYGNGNTVIHHQDNADPDARKSRIRVLDESSRYTPLIAADSGLADTGLIAVSDGSMHACSQSKAGGMDIFQYDAVMRCDTRFMPKGLQSDIRIRSIDGLRVGLREMQHAVTVGPSLLHGEIEAHDINQDPSLGSNPPFANTRMVRAAVYGTANGKTHVTVFDGRPESELYRGVTPVEAIDIIKSEHEIVWGAFLDPGRTAKLLTRQGSIETSYANTHYLRWPAQEAEPYRWVPGTGRPVSSAITFRAATSD